MFRLVCSASQFFHTKNTKLKGVRDYFTLLNKPPTLMIYQSIYKYQRAHSYIHTNTALVTMHHKLLSKGYSLNTAQGINTVNQQGIPQSHVTTAVMP